MTTQPSTGNRNRAPGRAQADFGVGFEIASLNNRSCEAIPAPDSERFRSSSGHGIPLGRRLACFPRSHNLRSGIGESWHSFHPLRVLPIATKATPLRGRPRGHFGSYPGRCRFMGPAERRFHRSHWGISKNDGWSGAGCQNSVVSANVGSSRLVDARIGRSVIWKSGRMGAPYSVFS